MCLCRRHKLMFPGRCLFNRYCCSPAVDFAMYFVFFKVSNEAHFLITYKDELKLRYSDERTGIFPSVFTSIASMTENIIKNSK